MLIASTGPSSNVVEVRQEVLATLLNRPVDEITMPPYPWTGSPDNLFIIIFQTVHRADANQTLYMGAVVRQADYDDRTKASGIFADDMSNGTGLSVSGNGEEIECEQYRADQQATADIIWVVDESGSTGADRMRIAAHAAAFFQKAIDVGLDFRMAVTDMNDTGPGGVPGIFASRDPDSSTGDKWILPTEPDVFATSIDDPSGPDSGDGGSEHGLTQGRAAIGLHTPRDNANPAMVREEAKLVVIYVTDEKPDEVEDAGILGEGNNNPTAAQVQQLINFIAAYVADFDNQDGIAHLISEPLPYETSTCSTGGAEHAFGYYELVNALGGQMGSICAEDLGTTLDAMIDSIIGDASPIVLSKVPISASISVTRDAQLIVRSRDTGWDFRGSSNSIIFFNMPFDPANPADIVVSYRRWAEQVPIE